MQHFPEFDDAVHLDELEGGDRHALRDYVWARDEGHCVYCGVYIPRDSPNFTLDHVRAQSKGGHNTVENLVTCCKKCNGKKADLAVFEWWQKQKTWNPLRAIQVFSRMGLKRV